MHKKLYKGEIEEILNKNNFKKFSDDEVEQTIINRFERIAIENPTALAVQDKNSVLTYSELYNQVNCLANYIQRSHTFSGDKKIKSIHLFFEHGIDMVVGMLASLKLGCCYIPISPDYPIDRINFILEDSCRDLILTNDNNRKKARTIKVFYNKDISIVNINKVESNGSSAIDLNKAKTLPTDLAYILYTSGSTGKPKGVMQNNRNVLHFIRAYTNNLCITKNDNLTGFSSYTFDSAVMSIYGALLNGASLNLYDIKNEGIFGIKDWLISKKISIFHSTPTVYRYFINTLDNSDVINNIRLVVMGGEAVLKSDVESYRKHFSDDTVFINGLGPTESTVTLQYFISKQSEINTATVPVGYPVQETKVFVVDKDKNEVEIGEVGELVFSSDYLALGYLNLPEKTNEVFSDISNLSNTRVYYTGDLGKKMKNGCFEFVGRSDFQVKIRGHRIELNEVEYALDP